MKKGNLFLNYKLLKRKPAVRSKKEKREKRITSSLLFLFSAFILMIIILGCLSYKMAAAAIMQKYENTVISAASSMSTSVELICQSISNTAVAAVSALWFSKGIGNALNTICSSFHADGNRKHLRPGCSDQALRKQNGGFFRRNQCSILRFRKHDPDDSDCPLFCAYRQNRN